MHNYHKILIKTEHSSSLTGLVPESTREMAQNGKGLGWQYHYGRVWSIWSDGATLAAPAGDHIEVGQG